MKTIRELKHEIKNQQQIIAFGKFCGPDIVAEAETELAKLKAQIEELEAKGTEIL